MNSLDYFNLQNYSNDIINSGGIKENNLLDSALSIKNNAPIDTLLNYIEKDKPDASEVMTVSDEELDLSKSLLENQQQATTTNANNTNNMNTIFIIIFVIVIILIIIAVVLYIIFRNKKNIKDKIKNLSKAINETYNNSSKNTNLSNSLIDDNDSY